MIQVGFDQSSDQFIFVTIQVCVTRCLNRNEGRSDDNEESLRKRIKTYHTQTLPIIEHYRTQNLVREVSACCPPDEVSFSGFRMRLEKIQSSVFL